MDEERKLWTREAVEAQVSRDFPDMDPEVVLAILDRYGLKGFQRERERVHLAILKLSNRNIRQVISYTKAAEQDYRDVLLWSSQNPPPKVTKEEVEKTIREMLVRSGIDPDNPPKWIPAHVVCPVCGEREPVAQIVWCDNQPMKEMFADIPSRRRDEPYQPGSDARPLREIGLSLLCRNGHSWVLNAHLSDEGVQWENVIVDPS
ncbi:MAG: hypothetical protein ACR2JW_16425 [Thermomicrobiales bacterium]